ncbi:hypothetical protein N7495_003873 [Penicillium taxi]|uniref:uncharacterized protein n=1 Tax=Penicillium taxi TaxID=168475 RepID=UPI0025453CAF|nr:uncharacterized protein N7495_003873 [Penicillium taxi]KAJ5899129.1 hypothetical protein N7495_003873 [Penicillium taxi]
MLDFVDDASSREKCFTTITQVSNLQTPNRSTILNHPFVHTIEAILPLDVYTRIQTSLDKLDKPRCAQVFMTPSDLLEHEFFNTYIKTGNILMISEGRLGSDTVFTLRDGILSGEMGKEIYERTGLVGKSVRSGGRKHEKDRFTVEINLRLPSMLHGKKGFEKIVWAFKNVLNQSLAWLFSDLDTKLNENDENHPINKHHPRWVDCSPVLTNIGKVKVPVMPSLSDVDVETSDAISEWIALLQLRSSRVSADDDVDPYLSRYSVPEPVQNTTNLISIKWRGLIPSQWTIETYLSLLTQTSQAKNTPWFVITASALGKQAVEGRDGFTILTSPSLGPAGLGSICWEFVGATATDKVSDPWY